MAQRCGYPQGDRFSLVMRNHRSFSTALGGSMLGAGSAHRSPIKEASCYQIRDSSSKGVIFTNEFRSEGELA